MFQTEFEFTLPCGYLDDGGTLHHDGVMRRATAADEILPLKDPRVVNNEAYLVIILLSRVITRLGSVEPITPKVIENLFASDLAYLQDFYGRINRWDDETTNGDHAHGTVSASLGESSATPSQSFARR